MNKKALLSKLVSIDSVYPREEKIGEYLFKHLKRKGFAVEKHYISKTRFNLLASKGSGEKAILFYGHMDTVPPISPELWDNNPYELVEKSGNLFGLGSFDMKAGIAAILTATEKTNKYVKIFFAADEENISEGAWRAVKERKGFFKDTELAFSPEPNFLGGLNVVNRGRLGRSIFQVNFSGKAVHIAEFSKGIDAVELLGVFTGKLYKERMKLFEKTGSVVQIRKVVGESVGMSVCANTEVEVEALIGIKDSIGGVQNWLQKIAGKAPVTLKERKTPYLTSYSFDTFPYQDSVAKLVKEFTGRKMVLTVRNSVGDDNILAKMGIPVINIGPEGGNAHGVDEFVTEESFNKLSRMLKTFLDKIDK